MGGKQRIAYLITSHQLPEQVLRLARVLRDGGAGSHVVVHHDDRRCAIDAASLGALGVDLIEPPSSVEWGDATHLSMLMRCFRWLLDHTAFGWLVLISGQDYPIRPVQDIEKALLSADTDAFIETHHCPRPDLRFRAAVDEFQARYHYRWARLRHEFGAGLASTLAAKARPYLRFRVMPTGAWIGVPAVRSPFLGELQCHFGSDWFSLSRSAVEAVDQFARIRPDVVRYYRRTLLPTESFFHTVLANDNSVRITREHRRYLVFASSRAPGPRVLRVPDLESIVGSGADFARKFDITVDSAILDEIDERVHGRRHGS